LTDQIWSEPEAYDAENDTWTGFQDTAGNGCLIYRPLSENLARIKDNFSDTYEATCTSTVGGQTTQTTRTYTREGLCVWRSRNQNGDVDGELYYRTLASVEEAERFGMGRILWSLGGAGFRTPDDGPYNSPAGRYGRNGQCVVA
jgi:hypothetical protein